MLVTNNRYLMSMELPEYVDNGFVVRMSKLAKENKELFLSKKYYKFQCEELVQQNGYLIIEMKLIERLLKKRREETEEEKERLIKRFEEEFENMKEENEQQRKKVRVGEGQINVLTESEVALQKELMNKEKIIETNHGQKLLAMTRKENEDLKIKLKQKDDKLVEARYLLERKEAECEVQVKNRDKKIKNLKEENDALSKAEQNELRQEVAELKRNLKEEKAKHGIEMEQLKTTKCLEQMRVELSELNKKLEDKTKMTKYLYDRVKRVDEVIFQRNSWKEKCDQLELGHENLNRKYVEALKEKKQLEKKLKQVRKRECKEDTRKVKELEDQIKYLQKETENLKETLQLRKSPCSDCDKMKKRNDKLSKTVEKLQKKLKERRRESDNELQKVRKELAGKKEKNRFLHEKINSKQSDSHRERNMDGNQRDTSLSSERFDESIEGKTAESYSEVFDESEEEKKMEKKYSDDTCEEEEEVVDEIVNSGESQVYSEMKEDDMKNEKSEATSSRIEPGIIVFSEDEGEVCEESIADEEDYNSEKEKSENDESYSDDFTEEVEEEVKFISEDEIKISKEQVADADVFERKKNTTCFDCTKDEDIVDVNSEDEGKECEESIADDTSVESRMFFGGNIRLSLPSDESLLLDEQGSKVPLTQEATLNNSIDEVFDHKILTRNETGVVEEASKVNGTLLQRASSLEPHHSPITIKKKKAVKSEKKSTPSVSAEDIFGTLSLPKKSKRDNDTILAPVSPIKIGKTELLTGGPSSAKGDRTALFGAPSVTALSSLTGAPSLSSRMTPKLANEASEELSGKVTVKKNKKSKSKSKKVTTAGIFGSHSKDVKDKDNYGDINSILNAL